MITRPGVPSQRQFTCRTPIGRIPFTITAPGVYCLAGDLLVYDRDANGIEIASSFVTVDLDGHRIGNGGGPGGTGMGIRADGAGLENITVENGEVSGFSWGVYLSGAGHVARDLRVDHSWFVGIYVNGVGGRIGSNQVLHTGFAASSPYGILCNNGVSVLDNDVRVTRGSGVVVGYGVVASPADCVIGNRISFADYGVEGGRYRDNVTYAVATPYIAGIDLGNNRSLRADPSFPYRRAG